jgi:dTDP-4-dehydrorhamnose 3,5-epimerase
VIFTESTIRGAYVVDIDRIEDDRGFFARAWCRREFEAAGLNPDLVQINLARSHTRGTLRGMHYQDAPHSEAKLARCTRGAVYDVIVDLRPDSSTFRRWLGVELTDENHRMLYVPEGVAHGYQTLTDDAELCYQTSREYAPESAGGVRYDDPAFTIEWPIPVSVISEADRTWPDFGAPS